MKSTRYVELVIEVAPGSDPIAGRVRHGNRAPRPFSGWPDLTVALEAALHTPRAAGTPEPTPAATPEAKNT